MKMNEKVELLCFVKFLEEKEYADDLMRGNIFCNLTGGFRKIKKGEADEAKRDCTKSSFFVAKS